MIYVYAARFDVTRNLNFFIKSFETKQGPRPCLVPKKFSKIFQISRHIESLDTCMEY